MRKWIAALMALALMLTGAACAEAVMAELRNMRKTAEDRIQQMETPPTPEPTETPEPTPTPDVHYEPLASGMKGDDVARMQQRLIDLGYLSGKADGSYGGKTAAAVKAFQQSAGLEPTGEADDETQRQLFWTPAPVQASYQKLDYGAALESPESCAGTLTAFNGSVLQVLEDETYAETRGIYTVMRVATRGGFDDVVYVAWFRPASSEPILEGDSVKVTGALNGLYEYVNEAGEGIALPRIEAIGVER